MLARWAADDKLSPIVAASKLLFRTEKPSKNEGPLSADSQKHLNKLDPKMLGLVATVVARDTGGTVEPKEKCTAVVQALESKCSGGNIDDGTIDDFMKYLDNADLVKIVTSKYFHDAEDGKDFIKKLVANSHFKTKLGVSGFLHVLQKDVLGPDYINVLLKGEQFPKDDAFSASELVQVVVLLMRKPGAIDSRLIQSLVDSVIDTNDKYPTFLDGLNKLELRKVQGDLKTIFPGFCGYLKNEQGKQKDEQRKKNEEQRKKNDKLQEKYLQDFLEAQKQFQEQEKDFLEAQKQFQDQANEFDKARTGLQTENSRLSNKVQQLEEQLKTTMDRAQAEDEKHMFLNKMLMKKNTQLEQYIKKKTEVPLGFSSFDDMLNNAQQNVSQVISSVEDFFKKKALISFTDDDRNVLKTFSNSADVLESEYFSDDLFGELLSFRTAVGIESQGLFDLRLSYQMERREHKTLKFNEYVHNRSAAQLLEIAGNITTEDVAKQFFKSKFVREAIDAKEGESGFVEQLSKWKDIASKFQNDSLKAPQSIDDDTSTNNTDPKYLNKDIGIHSEFQNDSLKAPLMIEGDSSTTNSDRTFLNKFNNQNKPWSATNKSSKIIGFNESIKY